MYTVEIIQNKTRITLNLLITSYTCNERLSVEGDNDSSIHTIQTFIILSDTRDKVSYTVFSKIQTHLLWLLTTIYYVSDLLCVINDAAKFWWRSREVNNRSAGAIEAGRKCFGLNLAWITHSDWETNYGRQQAVLSLYDCRAHPHYAPSHRWLGLRGRGRFLQLLVSTQLQNWIEIP